MKSTKTGDNSYVVKLEAQLPTGWKAGFGMDMSVAGVAETNRAAALADDVDPRSQPDESRTVAWATLSVPAPAMLLGGQGRIRAQINPYDDTATITGSVARTRALGNVVSASVVSNVVLTETGLGTASLDQSWEANRSLRLDFKPTGTALVARGQIVGPDPDLNAFLTAEQPLGHGLGVTTSLSEIETGHPVVGIAARFNRTW